MWIYDLELASGSVCAYLPICACKTWWAVYAYLPILTVGVCEIYFLNEIFLASFSSNMSF